MMRDIILTELAFSRSVVADGTEVVPRFTIFAPDGPHYIMVQMPEEPAERAERLLKVRLFMIWKAASGFVLANELLIPEAISVVAVTRRGVIGAFKYIDRSPLTFNESEWFGSENVRKKMLELLPPQTLTVTHDELAIIGRTFE